MARDPLARATLYDRLLPAAALGAAAVFLVVAIRRGGLMAPYDRLAGVLVVSGVLWALLLWRGGGSWVAWEERLQVLSPRRGWAASWGLAAVYVVVLGVYVLVRHQRFNSGGFDLAIHDQVVWNTAHGRPFGSSLEVFHFFGDHVVPSLALLAPLYRLWPDPASLLLAQTAALATCGPAAYRLALTRTGEPWMGVVACGLVLMLPAVGFMNRYDVHTVVFATPLLLWCLVWAEEGKIWWSRAAALLALGTKEDVGLVVALMALVLWWRGKWGREAWIWALGSVGYSLVAFLVVLPHFREGVAADTLGRYAYLGSTPGEIVRTLLTRPHEVLRSLFTKEIRLLYLCQLFLPFAGRSLLAPLLLLPLLTPLAVNVLSTNLSQVSVYFQYMALLVPFLVWAAVRSLPAAGAARGRSLRIALVLVVGTLAANVVDPALFRVVRSPYAEVHGWERWIDGGAFETLAGRIGPEESVVVTDALAPHLSRRERIWVYRGGTEMPAADWYLVKLSNTRDVERPEVTARDLLRRMRENRYGVEAFASDMVLLRKGSVGDSVATKTFLAAASELTAAN